MNQLSIPDALDAMQSDNKLWNLAETKPLGGGRIEKVINLPWGIGELSVTLEGMDNAIGKRNAFGAYGDYIRGVIRDTIDDDAVTSRAKVAAAQAELARSRDSAEVSDGPRVRQPSVPTSANAEAGQAYEPSIGSLIGSRAAITSRRNTIEARIERLESDLATRRKELRILNSVLVMMEEDDAPEDSSPTSGGSEEQKLVEAFQDLIDPT